MRIRWFSILMLIACGGLIAGAIPTADAGEPSLIRFLPEGALGTVEISDLAPILQRVEKSPALKAYLDSPLYDEVLKTDQASQALAGKAILEAQLGMDLWTFSRTFLGDRIALGIYASATGGEPDGVLIVQVKNAADLTKLVEKLRPLVALAKDKISVSTENGNKVFQLPEGTRIVVKDRWIVTSRNPQMLSQTLDRLATGTDSGLEGQAAWKSMSRQMGGGHTIQICSNLSRLTELKGQRLIPEKLDNPIVSLLYGGLLELAASSPYWGLTLDIGDDGFSMQSSVSGKASDLDVAHQATFVDPAHPRLPLIPKIPNRLFAMSFSRNLLTWYQSREQLLEAKLLPEFDKFETGIATFLSGKDFAEDILPLLTGRVAFVAAPQDYSYLDGKPGVQLPAFGLVIELAKPQEGSDILNLVAQTILAISNLEAPKQKREAWVQSSESYQGVQITFARYLSRPKGDQLATAYNFQPATTLVGNRFILSSSLGLCRQLVDTLSSKESLEATAVHPVLRVADLPNLVHEFSPEVAATLLEANAAVIHAKSIQNGKTAEQSSMELQGLCQLLRHLTTLRFDTVQYADHVQVELHGGWK